MSLILNAENKVKIKDNISNSEILIYYRMPDTEERVFFRTNVGISPEKIYERIDIAVEAGLKIMTGFRKGDIKINENGSIKDISSDKDDKDYNDDWKDFFKKYRPDIPEMLAYKVFFSSCDFIGEEKN